MFATLTNNTPSLVSGAVYLHNGVQHPVGGLQFRSDQELATIGLYRVHQIPAPQGAIPTGAQLVWTGQRVEQRTTFRPPSESELKETFRRAVQAHIDTTAQARMYDNGASLAGYVNSAVPTWAAEAQAFVAWRDQVWLFVFQQLALVEAGTIPAPTSPQELIDTLPAMQWPEE